NRFPEIKYQGNTFTSTPGNIEDALSFGTLASEPEKTPQGHLAMPYAGATFHRRGETLVAIKGNSSFVWDYEKESCGQLGRYLSRGSITIYPGSLKNAAMSWQGWDYAHIPGATAPALPPEKLDPGPIKDESRHYTDEGAVGGMAFGGNGAWMMRFVDATYDKTFGFDQSAFAVGDTIVVLGNAIRSADAATPIHTTLFQHILPSPATATTVDGKAITALPFDQEFTGPATFRDSVGTGYAIPAGVKVRLKRDQRNWPDNAFGRETGGRGNAEMALIDHGKAPKNDSYEYAILLNGLAKPEPYQVLRRDRTAHIVAFPERKITVYAVFAPGQPVDELIEGVSEPALIAIEERDGKGVVTACGVDFAKNFRPKGTARDWFRKTPETPLVNAPNQLEIKLKGRAPLKLPALDGAAAVVAL
ncbi:MAG: polysaccharide lyase family 8 super-sandwich domain-containing protein, partial [Victivallaceae bacterium]